MRSIPQHRVKADRTIESTDDLPTDDAYDGGALDGSDPLADNQRRASFAAVAVCAYAEVTGNTDLDTVIGDLMGDMQHLLDLLREYNEDGVGTIESVVHSGTVHYEAEIRGEF